MEQEYIYLNKKGEQIVHTLFDGEFKLGKAVYSAFHPDKKLNVKDSSWDVGYFDGNPGNCNLTNLYLKQKG